MLEKYYREVFELGQRILSAFALALDMPRDSSAALYRHPLVRARLMHYPPQPESADDGQYGAAEHTDYGTITILWQDDVGGLQVKNRAGKWIDAPLIDGTFVINIGDMLDRGPTTCSSLRRTALSTAPAASATRFPVFYDPDYDVEVECLPNCSSADNPPKHAPVVAGDYITRATTAPAYRQPAKSW